MSQLVEQWSDFCATGLWRATWQGAVAIGLVSAIGRWCTFVSPRIVPLAVAIGLPQAAGRRWCGVRGSGSALAHNRSLLFPERIRILLRVSGRPLPAKPKCQSSRLGRSSPSPVQLAVGRWAAAAGLARRGSLFCRPHVG